MNFATFTNLVTMIFCMAVLVQSIRMMRCLNAVKGGDLPELIGALDASTSQALHILEALRETLRVDCAANALTVAEGKAMREELTVMSGIADAVAERIVEVVGRGQALRSEMLQQQQAA